MLKYGYNPRVASGVILGSATLAQIIPRAWSSSCWPTSSG